MIVKLKLNVLDALFYNSRKYFNEHRDKWYICIPPFRTNKITVIINDESNMVPSRHIKEIINDNRFSYDACSYCGYCQEGGKEVCKNCFSGKKYLKPLVDFESIDSGTIMKNSISDIFKMP